VTTELAVHDLSCWPAQNVWSRLLPDERAAIAADDDWLRFTIVRHPGARLWSAWQSKLLLREPRYARWFGEAEWFPRIPESPAMIIEDFRAFVKALANCDRALEDAHWASQSKILADASWLSFIGRAEDPAATLSVLRRHLADGEDIPAVTLPRANRSLLPYSPALYDSETARLTNLVYGEDLSTLGYPPLEPGDPTDLKAWSTSVASVLSAVESLIQRHDRIAALSCLACYGIL